MRLSETEWNIYYGRIKNVHEWLVKPCPAKKKVNTTTTYVLTRLIKRWRRTRARVESTMMVVHMVPKTHHPAARQTAGSPWSTHNESPHYSWGDLFVSASLSLWGWIRNEGGLVNPRLVKKMTWCITEELHCCTPKLCCDVCALIVNDSGIYCVVSDEKHHRRLMMTEVLGDWEYRNARKPNKYIRVRSAIVCCYEITP